MKKIIIGFVCFLILALIMELIVSFISKDDPDVHEKIISLKYSDSNLSKKLGEFKAMTIDYKPINFRKDSLAFTIGIQGVQNDILYSGSTVKIKNKWILIKLNMIKPPSGTSVR
jgi:hypothetical protein